MDEDDDNDNRVERMVMVPVAFYDQMLKAQNKVMHGQNSVLREQRGFAEEREQKALMRQYTEMDDPTKQRTNVVARHLTETLRKPKLSARRARTIAPMLDELVDRQQANGISSIADQQHAIKKRRADKRSHQEKLIHLLENLQIPQQQVVPQTGSLSLIPQFKKKRASRSTQRVAGKVEAVETRSRSKRRRRDQSGVETRSKAKDSQPSSSTWFESYRS